MSWNDILEEVYDFTKINKTVWFRGQSKSSYELKSSLFRQELSTIKYILINERARYNWFKNLGHIHHNADDWNLLYLMQHHGVKTRLLDWTESFATALFFAFQEWEENKEISVWIISPQKLNYRSIQDYRFYTTHNNGYREQLYEEDGESFFENSVALHPLRSNPRIVAQQGLFTIQGNSMDSLDKEFDGELLEEGILKEITIQYGVKEDVKKFLTLAGVHSFSLFPDLKGLSKYVNELTDNFS